MRSKLEVQVLRWMRDRGVPHAGERVGVAVSGGADSVALLLLLQELCKELGIVLSVVHLNHKLRGRAADADEKFVARLAAKHKLAFHVERIDVQRLAKQKKANLEDTARRERYAFFERLIAARQLDGVAVAHTADDQAETVLAHILRGTGLAGLGGIHPVAGHVFRPLLEIRRAELRKYLKANKQLWREDATNRDTTKMRARIRHKLLPLMEKEFQTQVVEHLGTLADLAREDEAFLEALAKHCYEAVVRRDEQRSAVDVGWLTQPRVEKDFTTESAELTEKRGRALSARIVRLMVEGLKPRPGQLNAEHVRAVLKLAACGASGKKLELPGNVEVSRERDVIVFRVDSGNRKTKSEGKSAGGFAYSIELGKEESAVRVPQLGCVFRFRVIDWPEKTGDTRQTGTALDRDALRAPLVLRSWRPGDKLHPTGHRNAHKLKRLLNKKHVGQRDREGWPVLTSGGVLAWARGFPVAVEFAANDRTRTGVVIVEEAIA